MRQTPDPFVPEHRQAIRLAITYFLGCAERLTRVLGHDLDTSVVYAAMAWENVRAFTLPAPHETQDHAARRLQTRTPVSVLRLSQVIGMPYETTRRHVGHLTASGLCYRQGMGMVAPSLAAPQAARIAVDTMDATQALLRDLGALGFHSPRPKAASACQLERHVARLSIRCFLDGLTTIRSALEVDMLTALMFLAINRHNFLPELEGGDAPAVLPDERRRPISAYLLTRHLGLPYETTRRHIAKLSKAGLCVRNADGIIIPAAVIVRPELTQASREAWRVTREFLEDLAEIGVAISPPSGERIAEGQRLSA